MNAHMTEPRCLIEGDGGVSRFQAGFVGLGKWFRRGRPRRRVSPLSAGADRPANPGLTSGLARVVAGALYALDQSAVLGFPRG
jgi:hypothetical protein